MRRGARVILLVVVCRWKFGLTVLLLLVTILAACLAEGTNGFTIWALFAPVFTAGACFLCAICGTSGQLFQQEKDMEDGVEFPDDGTPRSESDPLNPEQRARGDDHV